MPHREHSPRAQVHRFVRIQIPLVLKVVTHVNNHSTWNS